MPIVNFMANGLGPVEKDSSVGFAKAGDGGRLTIGGRRFGKGFGTRVYSSSGSLEHGFFLLLGGNNQADHDSCLQFIYH